MGFRKPATQIPGLRLVVLKLSFRAYCGDGRSEVARHQVQKLFTSWDGHTFRLAALLGPHLV